MAADVSCGVVRDVVQLSPDLLEPCQQGDDLIGQAGILAATRAGGLQGLINLLPQPLDRDLVAPTRSGCEWIVMSGRRHVSR